MLYERQQLPELRFLKHLHDTDENPVFLKYDDMILDKSLSPHMYKNDYMNGFLKSLQPLVAILIDQMTVVKNFKNYMLDKYDYRQK